MKAYKAFNKDMTCRGFQYAEGGDYALPEGQEAKLCANGFHACERAVDVLSYYNAGHSVVHEVEVDGVDPRRETDSKVCGSRIHIGARHPLVRVARHPLVTVARHPLVRVARHPLVRVARHPLVRVARRFREERRRLGQTVLPVQEVTAARSEADWDPFW